MEPLFRNIDIRTEQKNREVYRNAFPSYHIAYISLIILSIGCNVYWMWLNYSINLIFAGYLFVVIVAYIIKPYSYAKKRTKHYKSLYFADETDEVLFYEDYFIDKDLYSKTETKIEYERITSVKITTNYYIFSIKDSKSKFTINNKIEALTDNVDFVSFINNRMVNSKKKLK